MEQCCLYSKCEVTFNVAQQNFAGKIQSVQLESGVVLGIENQFQFQNRIVKVRNRILVVKFQFRLSIPGLF